MSKNKNILDQKQQNALQFLYDMHQRNQDQQSEPTLNVNIELAKAIYRDKLITPFTTYLALKFIARVGHISVSTAAKLTSDTLGHKDTRSVNKALKQLLALNWIGTDGNYYFIRAFKYLERKYKVKTRKAGLLKFSELSNIREWIIGYALGRRYKDFTRVKKAGTPQRYKSKVNARTCSISIISQELGLSRSTACALKQKAAKLGYFRYKNPIELTGINPNDRNHASKMLDEVLFIKHGEVYRKLPSVFEFNMKAPGSLRILHFKRRPSYHA